MKLYTKNELRKFECHGCDKVISESEASVFGLCKECAEKERQKKEI